MARMRRFGAASVVAFLGLFLTAGPASATTAVFTVANGGPGPVSVKALAVPGSFNVNVKPGCGSMLAKDLDPAAAFAICLPGGATLIFGVNVPPA